MRAIALPDEKQSARQAGGVTRTVNAGLRHHRAGRLARAAALYRKALAKNPEHAEAFKLLVLVMYQRGEIGSAVKLIERALPDLNDQALVHLELGYALQTQARLDEAAASYRRGLALRPDVAEAHNNLGYVLQAQNRLDEAAASYHRAVQLKPDFAEAHNNLGVVFKDLGEPEKALASCQRAVALAPRNAVLHNNLACALRVQNRLDDAATSYRQALALDPDYAQAHCNLGYVLNDRGKLHEAIACFERAVALEPHDAGALSAWFRQRQNICDWSSYWDNEARVRRALVSQPSLGSPLTLLRLSSTPEEQFDCARSAAAKIAVPETELQHWLQPKLGERIRIGYLSEHFHQHPVSSLIAELIERHDRRRFEVLGYSYGPDDRSAVRARLRGGFDRFVELYNSPHRRAAALIHGDAVDILIDLTGYTGECRPAIFAYRAAPIQVNYLGFPGTMGADFIDYIIVDRFLVPPDQQRFYAEKLVHLPNCYQPSDTRRQVADAIASRDKWGLPNKNFIFCCFNNSYKITPAFFEVWMRLLKAVPASVLWLIEANPLVKENLQREAMDRGVTAERLVFAPRMAMPDYLAGLRLADLFLDTLPYNAGATANDALWVGLPVLTCTGKTYVGRMAGALLTAIGVPELITTSLEEYEALALRLATEPSLLVRLRQKLARNRSTMPLFDIAGFTRDLEAVYTRMWEIWRSGRPPVAFSVPPSATTAR